MLRPVLLLFFLLLSLLCVIRAPTNLLWYLSILVTEFSWIFFLAVLILLLPVLPAGRFPVFSWLAGLLSLVLLAIPILRAYLVAPTISNLFKAAGSRTSPFVFSTMVFGTFQEQVSYQTKTYDTAHRLTLDFYPASSGAGPRPCVVVVHGGSWAGGDSHQLPDLNSRLAKAGYHVAAINYRLAPRYQYPAPVEDLTVALQFLRSQAGSLLIDTSNFVLLGRSAGGQIVLNAAYTVSDPGIKGVISFYGPADMVWGYANPTNPLVLNSRKVMEDYLGGTYQQVPQQYTMSSATGITSPKPVTTLLLYGQNDPLVSHLHGIRLAPWLDKAHITHYDVYLPWATHAFDYTLSGPGGQISTWCVMRFLEIVTGQGKTLH